ncbi:hypothetical protein C8R44DRAFT_758194 [Mycena epipterygia]|nr:hypothetical protein C8R44DRAFT_758194 [Mycena epipterygia]
MSRSPSSLFGVEYAYAPLPQVPSMHLAPTRSDPRMGSFVDPRYYRGPSTSNSEARTMDIHQQYMQRGVQMGPPRSASRGENRPLRDTTYHRRRAESTSQYGSSWSGSHAQFRPLASESSGSQMPILNRSTQSLEDTPMIEYLKDRDIGLFSETETLAQEEASDSEGKLELYIVNQNGHFVLALHTVVPRKRNKDGYVAQRAGETPRFISHTPLP